ncbi:MAG: glycosyl hydrolase [Burkholderiaceae bacterium]
MINPKKVATTALSAVGILALSSLSLQSLAMAANAATSLNAGHARSSAETAVQIELVHIHGLSYSSDGQQILIPSHNGIAIYSQGGWSMMVGPKHDYMGFSATRDALYSSGHPAPGSNLVNPFGLIKSNDGGKTWQKLGLEGESDFHTLATSYGTNAIYVVNHQANSQMKTAGIYATESDGATWQQVAANGLKSKISSLAVHPNNPKLLAAGAGEGLYLSSDGGNHFKRVVATKQVLGQWFDLDGKRLWFGSYAGRPALSRIDLSGSMEPQDIRIPVEPDDAIAYIAQNPVRNEEFAIATFKRSVYVSPDSGISWTQIASKGAAL